MFRKNRRDHNMAHSPNVNVKVPIALRVSRIFDFPELMVDRGFNIICGKTATISPNVEITLPANKAKALADRHGGQIIEVPDFDIQQVDRIRRRCKRCWSP
jgi:hypothetical protein